MKIIGDYIQQPAIFTPKRADGVRANDGAAILRPKLQMQVPVVPSSATVPRMAF